MCSIVLIFDLIVQLIRLLTPSLLMVNLVSGVSLGVVNGQGLGFIQS